MAIAGIKAEIYALIWKRSPVIHCRNEIAKAKGSQLKSVLAEEELNAKILLSALERSVSILELSLDGFVLSANRAFQDMLGYSEEEIVGKHHSLFLPPGHKDFPAYQQFWKELAIGNFQTGEFKRVKKNGAEIWVRGSYTPIKNSSGRYYKIIKISHEVTEQKKTSDFLQTVLDSANYGVISTDSNGTIISFSRAAEKMLGYKAEELVGRSNPGVFHLPSEVVSRAAEASVEFGRKIEPGFEVFICALKEGKKEERVWTYVRKDRTFLPVLLSISAMRDPLGEITGYMGIASDITERLKAEEELQTSLGELSEFKTALDQSALVAMTDLKGRIIYANEKFCEISKFSRQELLGKDHRILNSGFHKKDFFADLWKVISSGKIWKGEIQNKAKDGSLYWVSTTIVPMFDQRGKFDRYLAIRFDITVQKAAELALENEKEGLAVANRELDQFAYVVSHDLKAPLRAIASLAQWIEDDLQGKLSEESCKNLQTLHGRVQRMEGMINGILAYARIGKVKVALERIDTGSLLAEVIDLLAPPPGFSVEVSPGMPTLMADRAQLGQVFSNLIGNAIKYHDKKTGKIRVEWVDRASFAEFIVSDDGPGIAPEYHEKIFVIFQTLQARDKVESTGIGLSIVKKLVEEQGGRIWVDSQPGSGSKFHFLWLKAPTTEGP